MHKGTALKKKEHNVSVFKRMTLLYVLVIILDGFVLLTLLFTGGTFTRMHENSLSILAEVTRNKYQILENKLTTWSRLEALNKEVDGIISKTLKEKGKSYEDMIQDAQLNAELVLSCADSIVTHQCNLDISGVFLVLNGRGIPGDDNSYAGMYIQDSNPGNATVISNTMRLLRGLPPLSRATGLTLDSFWKAAFTFPGGAENPANDYFYKPLEAYQNQKTSAVMHSGYWSYCFQMDQNDNIPIFTYSLPLVNAQGEAYGVLGVKLDTRYISSVINNGQYSDRSSQNGYFLGVSVDGGKSYQNVLTTGAFFLRNFYKDSIMTPLSIHHKGSESFVTLKADKSGADLVGAIYPLSLYSRNTVFSNEQWALIGMQESDKLFALENDVSEIVLIVIAVGIVLGIFIALIAARNLSKPITALVGQLKRQGSSTPQALEHTGFTEVDMLADTISELNRSLVEDASRISKIITLSGLPVGAFEKRKDQPSVFCSDGFFTLMDCHELRNENSTIPQKQFQELMEMRMIALPEESNDTFLLKGISEVRYLRLRLLKDEKGIFGTILNVTNEVKERRRIEHERDYDLLTNIFNRRAFEAKAAELFSGDQSALGKASALMMMDLDNLKALNDAYGHDCGDLYIRTFAKGLDDMRSERCLVARRSGDEFYMLYYGYSSQDEIRKIIHAGWERLMSETFALPDGTEYKIRASAGIAWFPADAMELSKLVHYADYAMYRVKNAAKGSAEEFNSKDYDISGYLFNGSRALNRLLEERLVKYVLQPIVSAKDGSVMGYEMLMRPQVAELTSPDAVLHLAKEQGKLYPVEYLTWKEALGKACELRRKGELPCGMKVFINSIASQVLTHEDENEMIEQYGELYGDLVIEITEGEQNSEDKMRHKLENVSRLGVTLAIDDFGTGYNSDTSLITINASYIKLDIAFVKNVDTEPNKSALIANVIQYAIKRNIAVIAEGVETQTEMEMLASLGVDYYQGYYIARPAFAPPVPSEEVVAAIQSAAQKRGGCCTRR
ncbi:MAG: GGDEF and EAL domain-containing protein [Clostridia bacterium]